MSEPLLSVLREPVFLVLIAVIGLWFFVLRTKATQLESKAAFDAMLSGGQPTVVEFFNNA